MSKRAILTWIIVKFYDDDLGVEFFPTYTLALKNAKLLRKCGIKCKIYHEVLKENDK